MDISMAGPGLSLPPPLPLPPPLQNGLSELAHILSQLPHGVMGMGALIAPNGEVNMDAVNGEFTRDTHYGWDMSAIHRFFQQLK